VTESLARLGAFVAVELRPSPGRVRAFLRVEAALVLASLIAITFKPVNAYWIVVYLLLVMTPTVGNSLANAIARFNNSVVGSAVAVVLIVAAYDTPWVYAPLQALIMGGALFIARSTPIGPVALTGGATFAIISGSDVTQLPSNLITLAFYRVLQAAIGGGVAVFAQLWLWPDDPLDQLRRSLALQLSEVETRFAGERVVLGAGRVTRHFELLANAQMRHPGLAHRRAEIAALIVDVGCMIDEALRVERGGGGKWPTALRDAVADARHRLHTAALFTPPAALATPPASVWREVLRETMQPSRRAALKLALTAFISLLVTQLLRYPPGGALFAALAVSLQISSGTAISKSLLVVGGLLVALGDLLMIIAPAMANMDDAGSFVILAAIAFAPTTWLAIAGARVRNAGLFGTVIVAVSLFAGFRPTIDLEAPTRFAVTIAIGALLASAVDRVVWPVDARRGMWQRTALMMREAAALYRERDPRMVLAPNLRSRWHLHRHLSALIQLRSERVPLPGTPCFAPEEEALRLASWTLRLVVARIEQARRELAGAIAPPSAAERNAVAAGFDAGAAELDQRARPSKLSQ
jgi:uncharacterized membrane protein YccC